uniref:Uncharacterized protein n=1 Tax=Aegilops tauschii TaxID=37682 RepID=M8BEZ9_AEGTA
MVTVAEGEETVRVLKILIKHEGSRRKSSWKDPEGRVISSTTHVDATPRLDLTVQHSGFSSALRRPPLKP